MLLFNIFHVHFIDFWFSNNLFNTDYSSQQPNNSSVVGRMLDLCIQTLISLCSTEDKIIQHFPGFH